MAIDIGRAKRVGADLYSRAVAAGPVGDVVDRCTIDTTELRSIAEHRDTLYELDAPDEISFDPPTCLDAVPEPLAWHVGDHIVEDPFVAGLQHCQLLGPKALTVWTDRRYVLENSLRSEAHFGQAFAASLRAGVVPTHRRSKGGRSIEAAVSLVGPWCRGYFHWFSEWLPRLEGAALFAEKTGRTPRVVAPPDPPDWLRESLCLVGFDEYTTWDGRRMDIEELVIPSLRRAHPVAAPEEYMNMIDGYRWVRRRILDRIDDDIDPESDRVYISRNDAEERRVLNEAEVLDSLQDYGFEAYELEQLSFTEQVRLFEQSDVVVGPHGAGLVNSIYGTDLTVVELFGEYVNGCYYTLAEGMGFDYGFLRCQPVGSDMRVDVERLEALLDQML